MAVKLGVNTWRIGWVVVVVGRHQEVGHQLSLHWRPGHSDTGVQVSPVHLPSCATPGNVGLSV